jgi:hypothetical protein
MTDLKKLRKCYFREATFVKLKNPAKKIVSKYGIDEHGRVAPPSQGGFGVFLEDGTKVTMWEVQCYLKEDEPQE